MNWLKNPKKLNVYAEGRKRRVFVGTLEFHPEENHFTFTYEDAYSRSRNALAVGPELGFEKKIHTSQPGQLFPTFIDRIPERSNPAYADYCQSQGISIDEKNPIILLGAIGRRGPSNFVIEPDYIPTIDTRIQLKEFRNKLDLSFHDVAEAFDLNLLSLKRFEAGKSKDPNLQKLIALYLHHKDAALEQLKITGGRLHHDKISRLARYFQGK